MRVTLRAIRKEKNEIRLTATALRRGRRLPSIPPLRHLPGPTATGGIPPNADGFTLPAGAAGLYHWPRHVKQPYLGRQAAAAKHGSPGTPKARVVRFATAAIGRTAASCCGNAASAKMAAPFREL